MQVNRNLFLLAVVAVLFFCPPPRLARPSDANLTPPPGSPLRKSVLDALRHEVKRIHGLDVVFVVEILKVKDGWAWAQTRPQSADGRHRYEDLAALLQQHDGNWRVAEIPCGEMENPDCLNGPEYVDGLQRRFPGVAVEIFPQWARQTANQSNERYGMQDDRIQFTGKARDRDRMIRLLDEILKEQGDFGVYGDLSSGLADVLKSNEVDMEAKQNRLRVCINPLSGQGHNFRFTVDIDRRALTDLAVGRLAPEPDIR